MAVPGTVLGSERGKINQAETETAPETHTETETGTERYLDMQTQIWAEMQTGTQATKPCPD